jgi:hypothetical protein
MSIASDLSTIRFEDGGVRNIAADLAGMTAQRWFVGTDFGVVEASLLDCPLRHVGPGFLT